MKAFLIALVCLAAVGCALARSHQHSNTQEWSLFKRQHGKSFDSVEEEARRYANYLTSKARVERHNADATKSYKLALNHMADWSSEEFNRLNGLNFSSSMLVNRQLSAEHEDFINELIDDGEEAPAEVDWRKVPGRVSEVKNQGDCGSCWAFATTGLLEGQEKPQKVASDVVTLSEQDLVDCSKQNNGCSGGIMEYALNDIKKLGGIMNEKDYPYKADDGKCKFVRSKSVMSDSGAITMNQPDEAKLKKVVAKYGPVSTGVFATENLQAYSSGVLVDEKCKPGELNHGVLIVGYGTDAEEGDYWIVKNSWDAQWGEQGYFRIKRGNNMCGIATIPTLAKF